MSLPYETVSVKARPIKVSELLKAPKFFSECNIIAFELSDAAYHVVQNFARKHPGELRSVLFTMKPYDDVWSEEAKGFLFMVRDRIAAHQEDISRTNKEMIYEAGYIEAGLIDSITGDRKHLDELTRREMWILTERMMDLAVQEGCDISDFEDVKNQVKTGVGA